MRNVSIATIPDAEYDRTKLWPRNQVAGPAIVTEMDSTTVVLPHSAVEVDRHPIS